MRITKTTTACLLALVFGSVLADDAANEALRHAVTCAEIDFALSVEHGDERAFAEFIHPDARFIGGGISRGREAVLSTWAPFFDDGGPRLIWRPMIVEVLESGDLALSRGPYRLQTTDENGVAIEVWGTFNSTWQRQSDGRWQVIFDAGSPTTVEFPPEVRLHILDPAGACNQA